MSADDMSNVAQETREARREAAAKDFKLVASGTGT